MKKDLLQMNLILQYQNELSNLLNLHILQMKLEQ